MKKIILIVLAFLFFVLPAFAGPFFDPMLGQMRLDLYQGHITVNADGTVDIGNGMTINADGTVSIERFTLQNLTESPTDDDNSLFLLNGILTLRKNSANYAIFSPLESGGFSSALQTAYTLTDQIYTTAFYGQTLTTKPAALYLKSLDDSATSVLTPEDIICAEAATPATAYNVALFFPNVSSSIAWNAETSPVKNLFEDAYLSDAGAVPYQITQAATDYFNITKGEAGAGTRELIYTFHESTTALNSIDLFFSIKGAGTASSTSSFVVIGLVPGNAAYNDDYSWTSKVVRFRLFYKPATNTNLFAQSFWASVGTAFDTTVAIDSAIKHFHLHVDQAGTWQLYEIGNVTAIATNANSQNVPALNATSDLVSWLIGGKYTYSLTFYSVQADADDVPAVQLSNMALLWR